MFRDEFVKELYFNNMSIDQPKSLKVIALNILNKHAPQKKRYVRNNQAAFMNKEIRKAIMTRSRLLNKSRKEGNEANKIAYNKQRNYCVGLIKKQKKTFYNNLNVKRVTDNKHCKTISF